MTSKIIKKSFEMLIILLGLAVLLFICTENAVHADSIGIDRASITGYSNTYTYEGKAIIPDVTVKIGGTKLEENVDYQISYINNINVGKATINIMGIGEYAGEKSVSFNIVKASFYNAVKGTIPDQYYTSKEIMPTNIPLYNDKSNVRLVLDQDFTIESYIHNINVGETAYVRIVSKNINYSSGELTMYFNIVPQKMENCTIDYIAPVLHDGKAKEPAVIVRSQGVILPLKDYEVTYSNNVNVGEATVTVKGGANCPGVKTTTFKIKAEIQPSDVFISKAGYLLGKPVKPDVIIKSGNSVLQEGKDYKIVFSNNTQPGNGLAEISGIGNYIGTVQKEFRLSERNIRQLQFSKIEEYTYNGESICPLISISFINTILVEGIDYTVSYSSNKLPGYGYIVVKGKGCYRGTARIPFVIKPTPTTISKCYAKKERCINLKWKKSASNCKYEVYRNGKRIATTTKTTYKDTKKLVKGKKYEYTVKVIRTFEYKGKKIKMISESSNVKTVKSL